MHDYTYTADQLYATLNLTIQELHTGLLLHVYKIEWHVLLVYPYCSMHVHCQNVESFVNTPTRTCYMYSSISCIPSTYDAFKFFYQVDSCSRLFAPIFAWSLHQVQPSLGVICAVRAFLRSSAVLNAHMIMDGKLRSRSITESFGGKASDSTDCTWKRTMTDTDVRLWILSPMVKTSFRMNGAKDLNIVFTTTR